MNILSANKKLATLLVGVALCFGAGTAMAAKYNIKLAHENFSCAAQIAPFPKKKKRKLRCFVMCSAKP